MNDSKETGQCGHELLDINTAMLLLNARLHEMLSDDEREKLTAIDRRETTDFVPIDLYNDEMRLRQRVLARCTPEGIARMTAKEVLENLRILQKMAPNAKTAFDALLLPYGSRIPYLAREARLARQQAYAPYSRYNVGAAILAADGKFYRGCNVESADYDGTHAEEAALSAMVNGGSRSPLMLVVYGGLEGEEPKVGAPCGKCRQKLYEFSSLSGYDLDIIVEHSDAFQQVRARKLSSLLPAAFGPAHIGVDIQKYRKLK